MSADWRQWPLLKPLDRAWRILATGFCFACFGIGGVLLGLTVLPVLYLISSDNQQLRRRFQRAVHHSFAFFVWQMKSLGLLTYEVRGLEKLAGSGQLIIANHPSLIDVVFLISLIPETDCVVKQALLVNPFTRPPIRAAGYIANRDSAQVVEDCSAALRAGRNLLIFPEGTRTVPGEPIRLLRGTANIALRADAPLRPVLIRCSPPALTKCLRWYQVPCRPMHFTIEVRDAIEPADFRRDQCSQPVAARRLTRHLEEYLSQEVAAMVHEPAGQAAASAISG